MDDAVYVALGTHAILTSAAVYILKDSCAPPRVRAARPAEALACPGFATGVALARPGVVLACPGPAARPGSKGDGAERRVRVNESACSTTRVDPQARVTASAHFKIHTNAVSASQSDAHGCVLSRTGTP